VKLPVGDGPILPGVTARWIAAGGTLLFLLAAAPGAADAAAAARAADASMAPADAPDVAGAAGTAEAVAAAPPASVAAAAGPALRFTDRAVETGLRFEHFNGASGELYFAEMMGPGAALFDLDGDGDLDVYLPQGQMLGAARTLADALAPPRHPWPLTDRLYRNDLETLADGSRRLRFTDVTAAAGLAPGDYGYGVAAGDYDNDGRTDLYVTAFGRNRLLRNRGDGTLEDATTAAGAGDPRWSVSAVFFDYDRDGWLDLYVVNYVDFHVGKHVLCPDPTGARDYCGPSAYAPLTDRLLRNRGDGTFEDVSARAGIAAVAAAGLGVAAADFDGDGWPDLYVANDGVANVLWINQRDGTFRDDALLAGVAVNAEGQAEASMGVAVGDADGDGHLDLFLSHLKHESNTLYLGDGEGMFGDATEGARLGTPSWLMTGFGTGFLDPDRDGALDLMVVNGAVTLFAGDGSLAQHDQLFHNRGGGQFHEATREAGPAFAVAAASRGAAFGDLDDDGDLDVLVADNAAPARLLLDESEATGGWVGLRLVTGTPARDALGALATLHRPGEPDLVRLATSGGSYAAANDPRVIFGLGTTVAAAYRVTVLWPSGRREAFAELAPGRYHELAEGTGKPAATAAEPQGPAAGAGGRGAR
jgi:enediyne biosynthesis protein E4